MILLNHQEIVEIVLTVWAMAADFLNQRIKLQMTQYSKRLEGQSLHLQISFWESRIQIVKTTGNILAVTRMFLGLIGFLDNPIMIMVIQKIVSVILGEVITHGVT